MDFSTYFLFSIVLKCGTKFEFYGADFYGADFYNAIGICSTEFNLFLVLLTIFKNSVPIYSIKRTYHKGFKKLKTKVVSFWYQGYILFIVILKKSLSHHKWTHKYLYVQHSRNCLWCLYHREDSQILQPEVPPFSTETPQTASCVCYQSTATVYWGGEEVMKDKAK